MNTIESKSQCLLGHGTILQLVVAVPDPAHAAPPCAGAGLLHERDRDFVPGPQVSEQEPYAPQLDHLPLTVNFD